jgi:hypothetical protein
MGRFFDTKTLSIEELSFNLSEKIFLNKNENKRKQLNENENN